MDARKYDALRHVAPGQFTTEQRQRLEAVTAAVGLLGRDALTEDVLDVARFIVAG